MNITEIIPGMRVAYIPLHAGGDIRHKDVEHGKVSSVGMTNVFVKFDKHVGKFGWDGATAQSCDPGDLIEL